MIRAVVVGFGKMGIFHSALFNAHDKIIVKAVLETDKRMLKMFSGLNDKIKTYIDFTFREFN